MITVTLKKDLIIDGVIILKALDENNNLIEHEIESDVLELLQKHKIHFIILPKGIFAGHKK